MIEYAIVLTAAFLALAFFRRAQRCDREDRERARYREMRRAMNKSLINRSRP